MTPAARRSYDETAHRRAFGTRIRQLRNQRGWTQEDLAERADLHRSYLAGLETGQRNPTLDVIHKIAAGLGVEVVALFTPPEA